MSNGIGSDTKAPIDYYAILGLDRTDLISDEDIKKAYRAKAAELHPDVEGGSTEDFATLFGAYQILSDRKSRLLYDTTGRVRSGSDSEVVTAMKELQRIVLAMLDTHGENTFYINLTAEITRILSENIQLELTKIRSAKKRRVAIKRYQKKFRWNGTVRKSGQNFIENVLKAEWQRQRTEIALAVEKIRLFETIRELLGEYTYIPEPVKSKLTF
jgi:DnaJ-class molecular chaperone